jgi:hypothetical protein
LAEDFFEEILKALISFQRWNTKVRMLYFTLEAKSFPTFEVELFLECSLFLAFEFERVLMD